MNISHIGLVAGDKNLPFLVCDFAKKNKIDLSCVGIKGAVSPKLQGKVGKNRFKNFYISELSKTIDFFKSENVDTVIIVGGVNTAKFKFTLDLLYMFLRLLFIKNKYDGILRLVIKEFEKAGFNVVGIQDIMPELLIKKGVLTDVFPSLKNIEDANFGLIKAFEFAKTDRGQSIIVKDKKVVAVENFSGTDNLIYRASKIKNSQGAILVKVLKPQQEKRADIPVLGIDTVKSLVKAKFDGVVIQSENSIIENKDKVIDFANQHNIFIMGIDK